MTTKTIRAGFEGCVKAPGRDERKSGKNRKNLLIQVFTEDILHESSPEACKLGAKIKPNPSGGWSRLIAV